MALPASVPTGTVIGRWWNTDGSDATGTIIFLCKELIEVPDLPEGVVLPIRYRASITAGVLNVTLPSGIYDVSVRLSELYRESKIIEVETGVALNLPDAIGLEEPTDTLYNPVRTVEGIGPDAYGNIDLPASSGGVPVAAEIDVDSTAWKVLVGPDTQTCLNRVDITTLDARSTGVRSGGVFTVDGGLGVGGTVSITAVSGEILDNTVSGSPVYNLIQAGPWTAQVPSFTVSYWYVDSTGTLQQSSTAPTQEELRTRLYLTRTAFLSGVVTGVTSIQTMVQQNSANIRDLASAIGPMKISGLDLGSSSLLRFKVNSGSVYTYGIVGATTPADPSTTHLPTFDTNVGGQFRYTTTTVQSGLTVNVDVANYQVGGVVTPIPGPFSRVGVHWVFVFPGIPNYWAAYGNNYYSSFTEARTALSTVDPYASTPAVFKEGAFLVGAVLATKTATDLTNPSQAEFVSTNRFGALGGAVAVSGGGFLTDTLIMAKGDLITGDAPTSVVIRSVGSNGQVLTADSAQTTGLAWTTPADGVKGFGTTGKLKQTFGPGDTSGTWTTVGAAWRVTVPASVGDILTLDPSVIANVGSDAEMDVCSVVSNLPVRYYSSGTNIQEPNGHGGLYMGTSYNRRVAPIDWVVQASDIETGTVTLAYMYRAGPGITWGSGVYPNEISLTNLGSP